MFYPIYEQEELAFDLVKSGSWLMLLGTIWGFAIGASAYPHLALYAHKQATIIGGSTIVLGLVVAQTQWIENLSPWECFGIWFSQVVTWPMCAAQVAASFWGTKKMTTLVCTNSAYDDFRLHRWPERLAQRHGRRILSWQPMSERVLISLDGLFSSRPFIILSTTRKRNKS
jgi:hypothetical protein